MNTGTRTLSDSGLAGPGAPSTAECDLEYASSVLRLESVDLRLGGALRDVDIAFTTYGAPGRPAVVVLGGISAGKEITAPAGAPAPGWWQEVVGVGRAIDPRRHVVIGLDFLGGSGESTRASGPGFPRVTPEDQARMLAAVLDHLGIGRVAAIVGCSYGGMVGLAFAARFSDRVDRLLVISAAHESHPMATALRTLQRRAVRLGLESGHVEEGMAIARGLAMTTYRTAEEFAGRFGGPPRHTSEGPRFPVEPYLEHQGATFSRRFPPWSFLCLSESIDLHRVDPGLIRTPTTLVGVDGDTLVPPWQIQALARGVDGARVIEIRSIYGHDAFLKEVGAISEIVHNTLATGGDHE